MNILIGVCGGVAAYKVLDAASALRKKGHAVTVAMTPSATRFVQPLAFSAVTGNATLTDLFPAQPPATAEAAFPHLYPATRCDVFLLAPATANSIARIAHGLGDEIVSTCALSLPPGCRRIFAPAMNTGMWNQPVVQRNVAALEAAGWVRIGPDSGPLACGVSGPGRMAPPEELVAAVDGADFSELKDRRVLILSGPTREHIDPVRFIGNASSGRMGMALADAALALGAQVDFISGPVQASFIPRADRVTVTCVVSAAQMLEAARERVSAADIVIYAAAVADYTPAESHSEKLPKSKKGVTLTLRPTPDIAATLCAGKKRGQVAIGFALQSHGGGEAEAQDKLARKNLDAIVLNWIDALGSDRGTYRFLAVGKDGFEEWGSMDKREAARRILTAAADEWKRRHGESA